VRACERKGEGGQRERTFCLGGGGKGGGREARAGAWREKREKGEGQGTRLHAPPHRPHAHTPRGKRRGTHRARTRVLLFLLSLRPRLKRDGKICVFFSGQDPGPGPAPQRPRGLSPPPREGGERLPPPSPRLPRRLNPSARHPLCAAHPTPFLNPRPAPRRPGSNPGAAGRAGKGKSRVGGQRGGGCAAGAAGEAARAWREQGQRSRAGEAYRAPRSELGLNWHRQREKEKRRKAKGNGGWREGTGRTHWDQGRALILGGAPVCIVYRQGVFPIWL